MNSYADFKKPISRRAEDGMLGGALLGMIIGLLYAGPHIHEWHIIKTALVIVGLGVAGGLLGYAVVAILFSTAASLPKIDSISDAGADLDHLNEAHHRNQGSDSYVSSDGGGHGGE